MIPRIVLLLLLFEGISCEWMLELYMQANVQYFVEYSDGKFCCCDTQTCYSKIEDGLQCSNLFFQYQCDVRVVIILSQCSKCPSECCLVYDIGKEDTFTITNASFQINETTTSQDSLSLDVLIKDTDEFSGEDDIDSVSLTFPFQQNATLTHFDQISGFHGIVEFNFDYRLHSNYGSLPEENMNHEEYTFPRSYEECMEVCSVHWNILQGTSMFLSTTKHPTTTLTHATGYTESPLNKLTGLPSISCVNVELSTSTVTVTVVHTEIPPEVLFSAFKTLPMEGTSSVTIVYTETLPEMLISSSKTSSTEHTSSVTVVYSETPPEMLISASRTSLMEDTASVTVVYTETSPEILISASKTSSTEHTSSVTVVYTETPPEVLIRASKSSSIEDTSSVTVVHTEITPEKLIGDFQLPSIENTVFVTITYSQSPTNGACVEEARSFSSITTSLIGAVMIMTIITLATTTISIRLGCILHQKRAQTKSDSVPNPKVQPIKKMTGSEETHLPQESGVRRLNQYTGTEQQPQYDQCASMKGTHTPFEGDQEPLYEMCVLPSDVECNEHDPSASPYEYPGSPIILSGRPLSRAKDYETPQLGNQSQASVHTYY